jgi:hypothetical protein
MQPKIPPKYKYCDMTPEICSQKSTAETSVARQRLAETFTRQRIRLYKSARCPKIVARFVATENNRGINCPTWCSIFGLHEFSSARDSNIHMQNSRDQATTKQADVEDLSSML